MAKSAARIPVAVIVTAVILFAALIFAVGYFLTPPATSSPLAAVASQPMPPQIDDHAPHIVYQADFKSSLGNEWSEGNIKYTPTGSRAYVGDYFPQNQPTLTVANLPAHKLLRITFDLVLIHSWDGSSPRFGPSIMDMTLSGGGPDERSLLHTTFSNMGMYPQGNNEQSFPDNYPARPYPAWTLAAENQSLGFFQDFSGMGANSHDDPSSIYHLILTFPHTERSVVFQWSTTIKDGGAKGYGFSTMQVETLPQLQTYTQEQFAALWLDLGRQTVLEAKKFYNARWNLTAAGDAAVDFIEKHLEENIDKTVANPNNDPLADKGQALSQAKFPKTPTEARLQRARDVLEAIHTPAALALKHKIEPYVPPQ